MSANAIQRLDELNSGRPLDWWLRFSAPVQARYDLEHAAGRTADIRTAILIGLILYNVYNVTSIVLLPDVLLLSLVLRAAIVTPVSLALVWAIGRTPPQWTERLVLGGILNAYLVPVFLFWLTRDSLGLFTFGELPLTIVFANMVLALRFQHAAIFTACAFALTVLAVLTKEGLDAPLRFSFAVQIGTACLFSLYANHRIERRRCGDYLTALGATLRATSADAARREFQNLSRTDALTGLPNRRHLAEQLDAWCATPDAVALMMIDIDHFKLFNDALGHPAGDDCLRRVAEVFAEAGTGDDALCARFGGEEFSLVLRNASEMEAARRARNLVQAIEALNITHPSRADGIGKVTISVGVARRSNGVPASPATLLAAADRALYQAKSRGRNRFVLDRGEADRFATAG
ncbi:GGDEF domain-containing protein [Methylobacterium radiodurans]|uniref:diguanylate cyclase n=1 Tax=Methylobacterium radiodurans TaxID=2202828 RepID=A0A2U8VMB2_9HYPH|nr:GGDEF domain-containing protein [Methylobacterium radiodurans]AWN34809.1 GGDEF domain-containing protein [Methylobacterium radiodurans]